MHAARPVRRMLALALVCLGPGAAVTASELFLENARIVDPAARKEVRGGLLIRDGRIAARAKKAPRDFAGAIVNVDGKWVIPGLVDLHTHSYGNMGPKAFDMAGTATSARRMLYAGVTAFLDLFGNEPVLHGLRERQRRGELGGADIFASLSCLTATKGHCTEYGVPTRTMDSPQEARRQVADLATRQPDVVKIVYSPSGGMPSIDRETLSAAIATAKQHDIPTVIHVGTWQDVRDAVEAGATAITHVPYREPVPPELAALMARRGVYHIPTLAVQTDYAHFVGDTAVLDHPLARGVAPGHLLAAYRSAEVVQRAAERAESDRKRESRILDSVRVLSEAGVVMLTGTDAGNRGTLQGYSMHRELYKLVQAGLSPWDALAAATTDAGRFLRRSYGVSPGDEANLLVLGASPIEDIRNTREIEMVIHHGQLVDREALLSN